MKSFLACSVLAFFVVAQTGTREARAQRGNPVAPPPGGANVPITAAPAGGTGTTSPAGTTGTTRPAGATGTTRPPGSTLPAGTANATIPATRLQTRESFNRSLTAGGARPLGTGLTQPPGARTDSGVIFGQQRFGTGVNVTDFSGGTTRMMFERNPGMFDRTASPGNPATAIPGRANLSGGSTSRTLRPGERIFGEANDTSLGPGSIPLVAPTVPDALFLQGVGSTFGVPITPVVPIVPLVPQGGFATAAAINAQAAQAQAAMQAQAAEGQAAPATDIAPVVVAPENAGGPRNRPADPRVAVPREPPRALMEQGGVATATAYPTRDLPSPGDAEVIATPPSATATGRGQAVEIPTTPQTRSSAYVRWQGYWWDHNPRTGWSYWDGARWKLFPETQE